MEKKLKAQVEEAAKEAQKAAKKERKASTAKKTTKKATAKSTAEKTPKKLQKKLLKKNNSYSMNPDHANIRGFRHVKGETAQSQKAVSPSTKEIKDESA